VPLRRVVPVVQSSLLRHASHLPIVKSALAVFSAMSTSPDNNVWLARVVPCVEVAMASHPDTPDVLLASLQCLSNLAVDDGNCLPLVLVVPGVVAALQRHPDQEALVRAGVVLLAYLCMEGENRAAMAEVAGLGDLVQALIDTYPANPDVGKWGGVLLRKLAE
jgi:hypothetical protein